MTEASQHPSGRKVHRLRLIGASLGLAVVFLGVLALASWVTATPAFCKSCHEMRPEYYTWKVSDHSQVTCVRCHLSSTIAGFIKYKTDALKQVARHISGKYYLPIELSQPLDSSLCLQCHAGQWESGGSGDIKIPHAKHLQQGIACTDCHAGVAHGRVAEREQTIDGEFASWNDSKGRSNMVRSFRLRGKKVCMDCHESKGVSTNCETCHKERILPEDHRASGWEKQHGKEALKDLKSCNRCHSYSLGMVRVKAANPAAEYARSNVFCTKCHMTRPGGHDGPLIAGHDSSLTAAGAEGCQVCHEAAKPRRVVNVTKTFCNQCHQKPHRAPGPSHPFPVAPSQEPTSACGGCHPLSTCARCHTHLTQSGKPGTNRPTQGASLPAAGQVPKP